MKRKSLNQKFLSSITKSHRKKLVQKNLKGLSIWLSGTVSVPRMALICGLVGSLLFLIPTFISTKPPIPETTLPYIDPNVPVMVEISRLGINLSIKEATVSANDWQIYDGAVSWLSGSGDLGGGNIILYGHNTKTLFGSIIRLSPGDQVVVKGRSVKRTYIVEKSYRTNRWDLTEITAAGDQLTMYTCSGWFDRQRWFVIAKPLSSPH